MEVLPIRQLARWAAAITGALSAAAVALLFLGPALGLPGWSSLPPGREGAPVQLPAALVSGGKGVAHGARRGLLGVPGLGILPAAPGVVAPRPVAVAAPRPVPRRGALAPVTAPAAPAPAPVVSPPVTAAPAPSAPVATPSTPVVALPQTPAAPPQTASTSKPGNGPKTKNEGDSSEQSGTVAASSLPPGIAKKIAKGDSLPSGIAKKLDVAQDAMDDAPPAEDPQPVPEAQQVDQGHGQGNHGEPPGHVKHGGDQ